METSKVLKVLSKTIGFDLSSVKPMSEEEYKAWSEENERKRKEWEVAHPEEVEAARKYEDKRGSKKPYTLKPEEEEIVKELLHTDSIDGLEVSIMNDGEISLRTDQRSWCALAGREWWINLQKKTCSCVAMS